MKNVLVFNYNPNFGEEINLVANNQLDLENYLIENYNFSNIKFEDIERPYGICTFKERLYENIETAKCFYCQQL